MSVHHKTVVPTRLTTDGIDEAIDKSLAYLSREHGPVELVGTSMVIERGLLFITVIAKSVEAKQ